jgi:hypothetical protein
LRNYRQQEPGVEALALGFSIAIVLGVLSIIAATWALSQRMERT